MTCFRIFLCCCFILLNTAHSLSQVEALLYKMPFNKSPNSLMTKSFPFLQVINYPTQTEKEFSKRIHDIQTTQSKEAETAIIEYTDEAVSYLNNFEYKKSLKSALSAYKLAKDEKNSVLEINAMLLIAQINMFWDNPETSLLIYEKITTQKEKLNDSLYQNLDLILNLETSSAYLKSNNTKEALELIEEVFENHQHLSQTYFYQDYLWNSGIAYFQKGAYQQAFDSLNKAVGLAPSTYYETLLHYYNGKFYELTKDVQSALPYYMKLDTLISGQKEIIPEAKEIYGTLNNYFLERGDRERQFDYLNKFLKTLSVQNDISDYVKNTTREQFEIPLLIEEKQLEIERLKKQDIQNRRRTLIVISMLLLGLFVAVFYLLKQRKYKKRFDELIRKDFKEQLPTNEENNPPNISIEVIDELLKKLDLFELNKEFLAKEVSLNEVSKQFQTNSTYLSKVVNLKKDKNFSNYINDLRIEHCIAQLNTQSKLRNYTIKALAEEMGFNNAQSFSTAFFKYTGIYPSFFVEQLKKSKKEYRKGTEEN